MYNDKFGQFVLILADHKEGTEISVVRPKNKKEPRNEIIYSRVPQLTDFFFFFSPEESARQCWTKNRQTHFKINMTVLVIPGINIQSGECTWRVHRQNSVIWLSWIGRIPLSLQSQVCTLTAK